ncbi:hypothetical protein, partial [Frankia nepalensis]|uniref:hypothetical protein n=1 Tax=Frankia nepalensis TaxID=1836974 RepID=UPI001EE42C7D
SPIPIGPLYLHTPYRERADESPAPVARAPRPRAAAAVPPRRGGPPPPRPPPPRRALGCPARPGPGGDLDDWGRYWPGVRILAGFRQRG